MKNIYRIIPLTYFTGLGLFWITENYMSTGTVNYAAIAVTLLIIVQFFVKNKVAGLVTGVVMGLFSFYLLLAMLADLVKVKDFTQGTYRFIAFGGGLFGVGMLMAILLTVYHAKLKNNNALYRLRQ